MRLTPAVRVRRLLLTGSAAILLAVPITAILTPSSANAATSAPNPGGLSGLPIAPAAPHAASHANLAPTTPSTTPVDTRQTSIWAGYAATSGPYSSASGTFVVPVVGCGPGQQGLVASWAGLDGLTNGTVEQAGIDGQCDGGTTVYRAWTEAFPAPPSYISSITVQPGDTVTASATDDGTLTPTSVLHVFTLTVDDVTANQSFSTDTYVLSTEDSSAECIFERPTYGSGTPNFAPVHFTSCSADGTPLTHFPLTDVTMSTFGGAAVSGTSLETAPGPMAADTSFIVSRVSYDPPHGTATGIGTDPTGAGYWVVDSSGAVTAHGGMNTYGDLWQVPLNAPITHLIPTIDGKGYWLVAADGGVFAFGNAPFYGSMGGTHLNAPVVSLAPTPSGHGYWLVASDGGIFAFGDAQFYGSMGGSSLVAPITGIAADPATGGYWLVAADDGIFSYHAPFLGSTGGRVLNAPVIAITASPSGQGYRTVASDGGIFAFGDATFAGSLGATHLASPVTGMAATPVGAGYWLLTASGTIYSFNTPAGL